MVLKYTPSLGVSFISWIVGQIIIVLLIIVLLLIAVAYYTLAERKVMASIQRRLGPNVVGPWGLLQPLADGLKLIIKEIIIPQRANTFLFLFSPYLTFVLSILGWAVIPFGFGVVAADLDLSLLYLLAISSLGIYGIVLAGWSSNSRYAFMGAIRSAAQMISYEITMGFVLLGVCLCSGSLNLTSIVATQSLISTWFVLPLYPLCIIFFISILAETNRAPFDLPEAEAELVSGYNTEYSSVTFALFFLGEYSNMLLMSSLWVILFWGGWDSGYLYIPEVISFSFKVTLAAYLFILVRAILPRYRYDKLLELGWKVFLPLTMGFLFFLLGILVFFDSLLFSSELLISSDLTSVKFF